MLKTSKENGDMTAPVGALFNNATAEELSIQLQIPLQEIRLALDFLTTKVHLLETCKRDGADLINGQTYYRLSRDVNSEWLKDV
jgi:hypothetical protein